MKNDEIFLFYLEGESEKTFYEALTHYLWHGERMVKFKAFTGSSRLFIGLKSKELARIKGKHPDSSIHLFICYDTDIYGNDDPFDSLKEELKEKGFDVHLIKQTRSLEDFIWKDEEGILRYLRLNLETRLEDFKKDGQQGLKRLFRKAKRNYEKGKNFRSLVNSLDMAKIIEGNKKYLKPLLEI